MEREIDDWIRFMAIVRLSNRILTRIQVVIDVPFFVAYVIYTSQ